MAELIIEILDRHSRVLERHKVSNFPYTIGRGYQNDLILSDPYVSPNHAVIHKKGEEWVIEDVESKNGLYIKDTYEHKGAINIDSGKEIYMGKTYLKMFSSDQSVGQTLEILFPKRKKNPLLEKIKLIGTLVLGFVLFFINQHLNNAEAVTFQKQLATSLIIFPFAIIWAGHWSFLGRVTKQKPYFSIQLQITMWFIIFVLILQYLLDFIEYNLNNLSLTLVINLICFTYVAYWFLGRHLKVATNMQKIKVKVISGLISGGVIIGGMLMYHAVTSEFNPDPIYSLTLKPPIGKFVSNQSIDEYFLGNKKIFTRIKNNFQNK